MVHEWAFGDWGRFAGTRIVRFIGKCCERDRFVRDDGKVMDDGTGTVEYLPDCTGFDWESTKVVPPEGHRLLKEGEVILVGDMCLGKGWESICPETYSIGKAWREADHRPCARKIEPPPGYRLVTDGEVEKGDMTLQDRGWYFSCTEGKDIAEMIELGAAKAYARKIELTPPEGYRLVKEGEVIRAGDMFLDGEWEILNPESCHVGKKWKAEIYLPYARKIETKYRPFANAAEFAPHRDKWVRWKENNVIDFYNRVHSYSATVVWIGSATTGMFWKEAFEQLEFEDGTPFGVKE